MWSLEVPPNQARERSSRGQVAGTKPLTGDRPMGRQVVDGAVEQAYSCCWGIAIPETDAVWHSRTISCDCMCYQS